MSAIQIEAIITIDGEVAPDAQTIVDNMLDYGYEYGQVDLPIFWHNTGYTEPDDGDMEYEHRFRVVFAVGDGELVSAEQARDAADALIQCGYENATACDGGPCNAHIEWELRLLSAVGRA